MHTVIYLNFHLGYLLHSCFNMRSWQTNPNITTCRIHTCIHDNGASTCSAKRHSISGGSSRLAPPRVLNSAIWWVFVTLHHIYWWDLFWVCQLSSPDVCVCNNLHESELIISVNRNSNVRIHVCTYKYYSSCKLIHGCMGANKTAYWEIHDIKQLGAPACVSLPKYCSLDCEVNPLFAEHAASLSGG